MFWNLIHTKERKLVKVDKHISYSYLDPWVHLKPRFCYDDQFIVFLLKIGYNEDDYTYTKLAQFRKLYHAKNFCNRQCEKALKSILHLDSNDDICYFLVQKNARLIRAYPVRIPLGTPR